MSVPDPLRLNVDLLPPAPPTGWLEQPLPAARRFTGSEAHQVAEGIIAYYEAQAQGERKRPTIEEMGEVSPDGSQVTFTRASCVDYVRRREERMAMPLGRWKPSVQRNREAFDLARHYLERGVPLPPRTRRAVALALGVSDYLASRARGDMLAQMLGQLRARGEHWTTAELARRRKVSKRTIELMLRHLSVRQRADQVAAFYGDPVNLGETDSRALSRRFKASVPHPRDALPEDAALRVIAGSRGNARQKAAAREVAYDLVVGGAAHALVALGFALGVLKRGRVRAAGL